MKYFYSLLICALLFTFSCYENRDKKLKSMNDSIDINEKEIKKEPKIAVRFPTPKGYERLNLDEGTFAHFLRDFPLLPKGEKVHLYDGSLKSNQSSHVSIFDIDVGGRDLQQCADAIMRLRAEFLFENKRYSEIAFNFTNGWRFEYQKWRDGNKLIVEGNKTSWIKEGNKKESYAEFRKYLNEVFMYAGTLSLSKELQSKPLEEVKIGDVIIKGGSPGHAVIVVDMCVNKENGEKAIMLAQSYMPAQQIHILKNLNQPDSSPWYFVAHINEQINTPEWTFSRNQLKSF